MALVGTGAVNNGARAEQTIRPRRLAAWGEWQCEAPAVVRGGQWGELVERCEELVGGPWGRGVDDVELTNAGTILTGHP